MLNAKDFQLLAHELRNSIHTINAYITLLKRTCNIEHLNVISDSNNKMKELVNQLTEYFTIINQPIQLEEVDINAIIGQNLPTILTDRRAITTIFKNLIGETSYISNCFVIKGNVKELGLYKEGDKIEFGLAIARDLVEKLGGKIWTTKTEYYLKM